MRSHRRLCFPRNYLQQIWNWNWNWNCGGNTNANANSGSQSSSQYQPVTSQYQPINVNISIRIASPGNDGAVTQTNLALAMPVIVQTAVNHPAPLPVQWLPGPTASIQTPVASVQIGVVDRHRQTARPTAAMPFETPSAAGAEQRIAGAGRDIGAGRRRRHGCSLAFPARSRPRTR